MSAALKREFVAGLITGVSVGFALWLLEKLQRRGGSSKNPLWGRASVRQPDAAALAAAVGGGEPRSYVFIEAVSSIVRLSLWSMDTPTLRAAGSGCAGIFGESIDE